MKRVLLLVLLACAGGGCGKTAYGGACSSDSDCAASLYCDPTLKVCLSVIPPDLSTPTPDMTTPADLTASGADLETVDLETPDLGKADLGKKDL